MSSVQKREHTFSQVPRADIPRSIFRRPHGWKGTFNAGQIIPIFVDEALPGDTFTLRMDAFGRLSTPIFPIMDNIYADVHFFSVAKRLVWQNWKKFNGEQANPGDSIAFLCPQVTTPAGGYAENSLADYFGIPTKINNMPNVNAFHFRAHNLIYNEWYRDQNLIPSRPVPVGDGPDAATDYLVYNRAKRHDYFTSALPFPQKGTSVSLPLGTIAPVHGLYFAAANTQAVGGQPSYGVTPPGTNSISNGNLFAASKSVVGTASTTAFNAANSNIYADLTSATAATINQLREAFQIQKLLERDARGGTRYTEIVRAHFGVISPDARQQRPEYLGGGTAMLNITPIAQTSAASGQPTPQGNLAAMGTLNFNNIGFTKSFTEHSVIIGYISVRADLNYQQGINRMWRRRTRYDFYWPALAHIGEQAILNEEIYVQGTSADSQVFGYQERHAEYRYKPSVITGLFRSNATGTLHAWHLAQNFTSLPTLGQTFREESIPMSRILAVPSQPHIIMDIGYDLKCARPMPLFGVPGLIDHF